jgi:hypothetical protein
MPTGPKGEKCPADVIGNAVKVMRIATGDEPEDFGPTDDGKDPAAKALGKKGGPAPLTDEAARAPHRLVLGAILAATPLRRAAGVVSLARSRIAGADMRNDL